MIIWLMVAIAFVIIMLGGLAFKISKMKKRPTDYYSIFIMGIIWLPAGILMIFFNPELLTGLAFLSLGLVYTFLGLKNKKKWKKNQITWNKLTKEEKKIRIWLIGIVGSLLIVGFLVYYLMSNGVSY